MTRMLEARFSAAEEASVLAPILSTAELSLPSSASWIASPSTSEGTCLSAALPPDTGFGLSGGRLWVRFSSSPSAKPCPTDVWLAKGRFPSRTDFVARGSPSVFEGDFDGSVFEGGGTRKQDHLAVR